MSKNLQAFGFETKFGSALYIPADCDRLNGDISCESWQNVVPETATMADATIKVPGVLMENSIVYPPEACSDFIHLH